jgi:hypothetical protein
LNDLVCITVLARRRPRWPSFYSSKRKIENLQQNQPDRMADDLDRKAIAGIGWEMGHRHASLVAGWPLHGKAAPLT